MINPVEDWNLYELDWLAFIHEKIIVSSKKDGLVGTFSVNFWIEQLQVHIKKVEERLEQSTNAEDCPRYQLSTSI